MKTSIKELQDGLGNTLWGTFLLYGYDTQTSPTRKNHQTETFLQQHMRNVTSEWIDVQKSLEKLGEKQSVDILNFDLFHYRPTKVLLSSS